MKFFLAAMMVSLLAHGSVFARTKAASEVKEEATAEVSAEAAALKNAVPDEFRKTYFGERPDQFLIDPQKLLSPVDYRERLDFLNYHAGDSAIDLYVYVFSADQVIPSEVQMEAMIEQFFPPERPAVIVHYYYGNPQRTTLHLSSALRAVVPSGEQRRALENSVMQALNSVHAADQIEAFVVQMSIRSYWMERMLNGTSEAEAPAKLAETTKEQETKQDPFEWLRPHLEKASEYWIPATSLVAALLLGFGLRLWFKLRWRYRLPEFEVEPRLGGAHAAGVGAVISFASAAVPPASQRDQIPDYLRRA